VFPYRDTVARRFPPVVVWTIIGVNVIAFLHQAGLPPRVLDRFPFDFAPVPSRFFGRFSLIAPADWTPSRPISSCTGAGRTALRSDRQAWVVLLDLSRFGAAPLLASCAAKAMNHGHRQNGRTSQGCGADRADQRAFAASGCG
jgi:hypothetical protein